MFVHVQMHTVHGKKHYVTPTGKKEIHDCATTKYSCFIIQAKHCPPVLVMWALQSLVIMSNSEESIGGFYAFILISIFPLSYWLFMKKGECHSQKDLKISVDLILLICLRFVEGAILSGNLYHKLIEGLMKDLKDPPRSRICYMRNTLKCFEDHSCRYKVLYKCRPFTTLLLMELHFWLTGNPF